MKCFLGIFSVVSLSVWGILEYVFPRPEGHWHVYFDKSDGYGIDNYEILNFKGNQISVRDKPEDYYYDGEVYRFDKKLQAWASCRGFTVDYCFNGDSLIMTQENKRHYALKFDNEKCRRQSHFFSTSRVNIELKELSHTFNLERLQKLSLICEIEIGDEKQDSKEFSIYTGDLKLTEDNISMLPLHLEKHRITVSDQQKDNIQLAFYADKKTKIKHLKPILQKLAEITDRPKVVLVFQYNPQPDDFELFGKEVLFEGVDWDEVDDEMFFANYVLGQN